MEWTERDGIPLLEAELPGARAAFSTRLGGVSEAPWDSLNLGVLTGDRAADVRENRSRLAAALGLEAGRVAIGRQVHGAELARHRGPQPDAPFAATDPDAAPPPEVDGHHTAEPGLALLVFVADCLPIAISGPGGVAMLHGGWRGLAAGIVASGVEAVGGTDAAIGPGIGPCCYRVGDEVLAAFEPLGAHVAAEGGSLDLGAAAEALLTEAGVERVIRSELCTRCDPKRFFSHRGTGPRTGRQGGIVWRTD